MMKRVFLLCLAFLIVGCSSTHIITKPMEPFTGASQVKYTVKNVEVQTETAIPDYFLNSFKSYLNAELSQRNLLGGGQIEPDREITITVIKYRMRSGFSRAMWGVFAGKDGITSKVVVRDTKIGDVIGSSTVDSYNASAIGTEQDVAIMHAKEIADFLEGK